MIKAITKSSAWLMTLMTQKDCATLKKLIVENPEAPLLIFAGEYANCGEYQYESVPSGDAFLEGVCEGYRHLCGVRRGANGKALSRLP